MLTRARGYKASIITDLLLYAAGAMLFYPAAHFGEYRYFLAALFAIASGLAFLETSANPLMTELGDPSKAAARLNWAQAANPVGTLTGVLIGKYFILSEIHPDTAVALMGLVSDKASINTAMLVPALCFLVVLGFAVLYRRDRIDTETAVLTH